jgi:hypothetical protein
MDKRSPGSQHARPTVKVCCRLTAASNLFVIERAHHRERGHLSLGQFVFRYNAFMLFTRTFDAILELARIMRELFGHFVDPAWHIATNHRREGYPFTDMEFMRGHRAHLLAGSTAPRRDSEPGT